MKGRGEGRREGKERREGCLFSDNASAKLVNSPREGYASAKAPTWATSPSTPPSAISAKASQQARLRVDHMWRRMAVEWTADEDAVESISETRLFFAPIPARLTRHAQSRREVAEPSGDLIRQTSHVLHLWVPARGRVDKPSRHACGKALRVKERSVGHLHNHKLLLQP